MTSGCCALDKRLDVQYARFAQACYLDLGHGTLWSFVASEVGHAADCVRSAYFAKRTACIFAIGLRVTVQDVFDIACSTPLHGVKHSSKQVVLHGWGLNCFNLMHVCSCCTSAMQ